ncbi:o-antigen polymerase [Leptolyngbya sp. Heron Island J]|uniref:O-antigen ligase family protein n=1 Tax=Leptolyngbya sp. Heron Island J TaxID=1385935 RepID=UPI0003B96D38|nr:O-antigen ligase family protein [Leptolyngbya sp. Heron Island J]ESA38245.1 o-antigen polymerase [Leptolyngbya sp. Heron Island J]
MSTSPESLTSSGFLSRTADGNLIGLLTIGFYSLFTLLPSSHSLMVSWPWVAVWQVTLLLPIIWLLWQMWFKPLGQFKLGSGLDWPIALLILGLLLSTLFSEFPNQARWYSWAALGGIAALYALSGWLRTSKQVVQLLKFQAVLGIAFILVSLGLWLFQTYFPELERLSALEPYGVSQQFDFGVTSLRNWYPLGHQNYVAGYLVLILPLLLGLAIHDRGWQRWLWGGGCCLGLVDLYTASSRGGLLALVMTVAIALIIILFRSQLPRRLVLPAGGLLLCLLLAATLGNSRVRQPLLALLQGRTSNSELGYRAITNVIGWHIGLEHIFTGAGAGSVLQLFQKYRPYWAGREAELHFQLHSTPAQLWAELGLWGIAALVSLVGLLVWLTWRWTQQPVTSFVSPSLVWSLVAGLFAYGLMGLTDYQLDTPAISGLLVVYLVVLATVFAPNNLSISTATPEQLRFSRICMGLGLGCVVVVNLWLIPIHRAWAISKQGFDQLNQGNFDRFEQALTQSHQLAPWEPYYPSMLAWALGDFSFQTNGASREALSNESIRWFEIANDIAPYQEFGRSNVGWLLSQQNPSEAVAAFAKSAELVPVKRGVFLGLGVALLRNEQSVLATDALVLELLRFPLQLTSPIWNLGELAEAKETVFSELEKQYAELLTFPEIGVRLRTYLQQQQGALQWWQGDYTAAAQSWTDFPTGQALLQLSQEESLTVEALPDEIMGRQTILAWLSPEQRRTLLEQTLIKPRNDLPQFNVALPTPEQVDQFVNTMNEATTFDDWLKNSGLIEQPRSRRVGFGALYRHIDGPFPVDYAPRMVNQPVANTLEDLFAAPSFFPELESSLQPKRQTLLSQLKLSSA